MCAVSPALTVGVRTTGVTLKSVTCTTGCETVARIPPPFALTLPEIVMDEFSTGTAGVKSTCTVAIAFTARLLMLHEIVVPWIGLQLPVPLLTTAWGGDVTSGEEGKPKAMKFTRLALSGPVFVMSNVNVTCVPAGSGLGAGLVNGTVRVRPLFAPILLTKASCAPIKLGW